MNFFFLVDLGQVQGHAADQDQTVGGGLTQTQTVERDILGLGPGNRWKGNEW